MCMLHATLSGLVRVRLCLTWGNVSSKSFTCLRTHERKGSLVVDAAHVCLCFRSCISGAQLAAMHAVAAPLALHCTLNVSGIEYTVAM